MSKSIDGDQKVDAEVVKLTNLINNLCKASTLRNLSKKTLRDLQRALGHAETECNFWIPVRDDQRTAKTGAARVNRGEEKKKLPIIIK